MSNSGSSDLATWNQAKAYMIRIDNWLRQANYFSATTKEYRQWSHCLLTVYRELYPYIQKSKSAKKVKEERNKIIEVIGQTNLNPRRKRELWSINDKFQTSLMVIMEERGLIMSKEDDWEESEA